MGLVPFMVLCGFIGAGWMYFFKPPVYYCPLPKEMSEMRTPPSLIPTRTEVRSGEEEYREIECEEIPGGITVCPKG